LGVATALVVSAVPGYFSIGSGVMPPLHERGFLYKSAALPGMLGTGAAKNLQIHGKNLKRFPEVEKVLCKDRRAGSTTQPSPPSMVETTVALKPQSEWPQKETLSELQERMDAVLKFPGMPNIWTMPIKNRIDMLATGIRTPVGIKILGPNLTEIQRIGEEV